MSIIYINQGSIAHSIISDKLAGQDTYGSASQAHQLNKTEDPSVPYAGQDDIRVLNVFEIKKP